VPGVPYCIQACPFEIRDMMGKPRARVKKCNMWHERSARASKRLRRSCGRSHEFGDRDALIAEARSRSTRTRDSTIDYIYGLEEAGYVGDVYLQCRFR